MSDGSASLMRRRSVSGGSVRVDVEVRDLGQRVDAGVGPAGAVELELARAGRLAHGASISPCIVRAFFWICQPL